MKYESQSDFVIAGQDVQNDDIIQLLDEGEWRPLPTDPKTKVLTFNVKLPNGKEKLLSINKTSQRALVEVFELDPENMDTKNWMKKDIRVKIVEERVFDKLKKVIYLEPVVEASKKKP